MNTPDRRRIHSGKTIDYALADHRRYWLSHPIYGDPSFDGFERRPGNPVCRGTDDLEWPVNGFLFRDPPSGNWFLYVGFYPRGYALAPGKPPSTCHVYRSVDAGVTWEHVGPVFPAQPFRFRGDAHPIAGAPDVSVVYADGRYHMAYDWRLSGSTWHTPEHSGVGYAWSDRPQGPFRRHDEPIIRNTVPVANPVLGKYNRFYATTLIRRAGDWMILILMDAGPHFAWGLVGMTAQRPEGPYGALTPLFHVEGDRYQPPLMEYFPAFVHDGWIYAPSTSVALNRNFQMIQRAPLEQAMDPGAWEIFHHGSVWHGIDAEHEAAGIWGQTLTGFVDGGRLHVMYPSKDRSDRGTINLAWRAWDQPYARRGFHISGHAAPSLAVLRASYASFDLDATLAWTGEVAIFWGGGPPLGPDLPKANCSLHPLTFPAGPRVQLNGREWRVIAGAPERECVMASGRLSRSSVCRPRLNRDAGGRIQLVFDGQAAWEGEAGGGDGSIGLYVEKNSTMAATRFEIRGAVEPGTVTCLYTDALVGAGQHRDSWEHVAGSMFRHGVGAMARADNVRAKWNVVGTGFTLWSPTGPDFGQVDVVVDDHPARRIDLRAATAAPSRPVLTVDGLPDGFHALSLKPVTGRLVVDCLEVHSGFLPPP